MTTRRLKVRDESTPVNVSLRGTITGTEFKSLETGFYSKSWLLGNGLVSVLVEELVIMKDEPPGMV